MNIHKKHLNPSFLSSATLISFLLFTVGCYIEIRDDIDILGGPLGEEPYDFVFCDGNPYHRYGVYGVRFPFGTGVQDTFWGIEANEGLLNGRLNNLGIWACKEGSTQAGHSPTGEWITTSYCLDVAVGGDYLIGMGVDNQARVYIDGYLVWEDTQGNTQPFNRWWLSAIQLDAGTVSVEIEAKNDGSIASLGAEIYGPWAYDDFFNDIDDTNMLALGIDDTTNTIFSTQDLIGHDFELDLAPGVSSFMLGDCL